MVAPTITFLADGEAALAAVYSYGTITTGSSGSAVIWQIWNNWSGSGTAAAASVSSAVCSGSDGTTAGLGLGCHDSGSADHQDQNDSTNHGTWYLPTGSLWVNTGSSGKDYIIGSGSAGVGPRVTGSLPNIGTYATASCTTPQNVYSGSAGLRIWLPVVDGKLSGSTDLGGTSGSAWRFTHYCYVPVGTVQGSKSGSWCLKYTYT